MKIRACAFSHMGKMRKNNEDNFNFNGTVPQDDALARGVRAYACFDRDCAFAVCDGMGGEQFGEYASRIAAESFTPFVKAFNEETLGDYVKRANDGVCAMMNEKKARSGSTFAAISFSKDSVFVANLGDSKIFRIEGDRLTQLSHDDTNIQMMIENGNIPADQAGSIRIRPYLTQYLGIFENEMVAEPNFQTLPIKAGETFLLCSDGLTDMLDNNTILSVITPAPDLLAAGQDLLEETLKTRAKDNVTFIVIKVEEP